MSARSSRRCEHLTWEACMINGNVIGSACESLSNFQLGSITLCIMRIQYLPLPSIPLLKLLEGLLRLFHGGTKTLRDRLGHIVDATR